MRVTLVQTIKRYTHNSSALQSRASRAAQAGTCIDAPTLRHVQAHVRVVHAGAAQLHGDQKQPDLQISTALTLAAGRPPVVVVPRPLRRPKQAAHFGPLSNIPSRRNPAEQAVLYE